jgi:hypothetical protein
METVKYILDLNNIEEEIKEMLLSYGGDYSKDKVKVNENKEVGNVVVTQFIGDSEYRFYGFIRMNKYYIGRVQYVQSFPEDMIIDEFFNFGEVLA